MSYDYSQVDYSGYYYNVQNLMDEYPNAFMYMVIGGRNTGKTFSALVECLRHNKVFAYIRRSIDDIKAITTSSRTATTKGKIKMLDVDTSPLKSVNRSIGSNIRCLSVQTGISAFMECEEDLTPVGQPKGYAIALNAVGKIKGIDLSDVDVYLFDEFGSTFEMKAINEEDAILELYKTITRDSVHKNKRVPIVALSNASSINAPLIQAFQLENEIIQMTSAKETKRVVDRDGAQIVIELLAPNKDFLAKEKESDLYKLTRGTRWNDYAYGNEFAYDDTSKVMSKEQFTQWLSENIPIHKVTEQFNIRMDNKVYTLSKFSAYTDDSLENEFNIIYYFYENTKEVNKQIDSWYFNAESQRRLFFKAMQDFIVRGIEAELIYFENYKMYELLYWKEYIHKGT